MVALSWLGRRAGVWVALLGVVLVARIAFTYPVTSATVDEGRHIAAGVEAWETGAFRLYFWSPALPRYFQGALPYVTGTRLATGAGPASGVLDADYWSTLTLGRLGTLAFVPVLLLYACLWSARLYGRNAGFAAVALVTLSPDVIGHAGLATTDVPSAATLLASLFHLWRWVERPSIRAALGASVAFAAAILCKGPAVLQLLVTLWLFLALARWIGRPKPAARPPRRVLTEVGVFLVTTLLCVWGAYRFDVAPLSSRPGATELVETLAPGSLSAFATRVPWPMPAYVHGLLEAWSQARAGWRAFLLGEVRTTGWWYYFPVCLGLKMTLPALGLLVLGSARCVGAAWARPRHRRMLYPLVAAAVFLGVAMTSRVDIGVRHVLPVEVVFAVLASAALAGPALGAVPGLRRRSIGVALLAWHATASLMAHPHYIAYFNPIAGGRERQYLGDSNLDWGQDVGRLALYLKAHDIRRISLYVFGADERTLRSLGIVGAEQATVERRPSGWVAASSNALQGLGPGDARWLSGTPPVARIGRSIFLYDVPPPGRKGIRQRDRIPAPR